MCGKSQRKDPCVGCPEITLNFCLLENQRWPREFLEKPLREDSKSHKKKNQTKKKTGGKHPVCNIQCETGV